MPDAISVYLAGPEVFLPNAQEVLATKLAICERMGWVGLSPVDNEVETEGKTPEEIAMAIYQGNIDMMERADAIIANITPFRGPHMDPGTAFEIGYFAAAGKPIMVYTQHPDELLDRVVDWSGEGTVTRDGHLVRDRNQHLVEDFGFRENLMIEASVDNQGVDANVVVSPVEFERVFKCCQGFENACRTLYNLIGVSKAFGTAPAPGRGPKP